MIGQIHAGSAGSQVHSNDMEARFQKFIRHFDDVQGIGASLQPMDQYDYRGIFVFRAQKPVNMQEKPVTGVVLCRNYYRLIQESYLSRRVARDFSEQSG